MKCLRLGNTLAVDKRSIARAEVLNRQHVTGLGHGSVPAGYAVFGHHDIGAGQTADDDFAHGGDQDGCAFLFTRQDSDSKRGHLNKPSKQLAHRTQ